MVLLRTIFIIISLFIYFIINYLDLTLVTLVLLVLLLLLLLSDYLIILLLTLNECFPNNIFTYFNKEK